ncbi:MAG: asparagine synthase (glutamine-hydrolyzing), partial [Opitutales bacterium]
MCGIFGMFCQEQAMDFEPLLDKVLAALKHRGPDDQGMEQIHSSEGSLGLGHTRLSIIDLSAGGRQPMRSSDERFTLVFNGEIYNYRELRDELRAQGQEFRTESDSEVLLVCWSFWGKSCLKRLRGMFAFAIHDKRDDTVTCARDAFGIKPFYYHCGPKGFSFASELPALLILLQEQPALNLQLVHDYLVYGAYDDREATFHEGVRHLAPGHMLTFHLSKPSTAEIERWWFPGIEERTDLSLEEAAERLREKFLLNVRLHLRSDVPLGVALSGGLDSSALVCAMRHLEPDLPINTFSFVARDTPADEERWVDEINRQVGAMPHKIFVDPEELADDLDDMIRAQGEPFGSTSIYAQYRVFRLAKEHGTTVLLEGQGADELLGGYHGYSQARIRSLLERGEYGALLSFLKGWSEWPGRSFGN